MVRQRLDVRLVHAAQLGERGSKSAGSSASPRSPGAPEPQLGCRETLLHASRRRAEHLRQVHDRVGAIANVSSACAHTTLEPTMMTALASRIVVSAASHDSL